MIRWPDRAVRHGVQLGATVIDGSGTAVETQVLDLSLGGCKLVGEYRIGERLEVRLPRIGKLAGTVRWSLQCRTGVRFIHSGNNGDAA